MSKLHLFGLGAGLLLQASVAVAADELEEVVVVGTQIKGAQISDALNGQLCGLPNGSRWRQFCAGQHG